MTARPKKPPKFTKAMVRELRAVMTPARMAEHMAEMERDEQDRRCRTGKYAPPTGTCRVCGGNVRAHVEFPYNDVIGGPPPQGYVDGWECDDCGVLYGKCPPDKEK